MNAVGFAWRSLVRQPARAALAILGVAAAGALLFDMLLLSQGLIVSMRNLLDQSGWDVRVTSTQDLPGRAPLIPGAVGRLATIAALPPVRGAVALRSIDAEIERPGGEPLQAVFEGVTGGTAPPWRLMRGQEPRGDDEIVVDEGLAAALGVQPGSSLTLRGSCLAESEAVPAVRLRVAGVAQFLFEAATENTVGGTLAAVGRACGGNADGAANLILVMSRGDAEAAARAVAAAVPELSARTNEEMLGALQESGFTYFRQISTVLTTVTLSFAVLLITVLLTVSVNQRLGEIAALRALGFSRSRVVYDVLSESALIVGLGGLLSLPLGAVLAQTLDTILKRMPGIPTELHFFVFEGRSLAIHVALLAATAIIAALYPMRIVSRLPISATLRDEVTG